MIKKIILSLFFIISLPIASAFSEDLGKKYLPEEYPDSDMVAPIIQTEAENITVHGGVQNTLDVTLDDCLKFALGNNPRIQAAMQDIFAADARIKQAWSNWFPQVSWQTGFTRIRQLQLSDVFDRTLVYNYYTLGQISLSEMLYDFGVTQNQVTIRKLENEQFKIILTETINDVICDVKNAYYNVLYTIEQRKVAQDMVERYQLFYEQAKAYYNAGTKPKVDMTIAQVNLSNSKLQLIEAENAVDIAMAKLNNTMGLPYMMRYRIQDILKYNPCSVSLDEVVSIAKESRPDFKLANVKIETARQNLQLTKKAWAPQITIEGQYQIGGRSFTSNYGYNFGAFLNFPTINGMLIRQEIKEAKALHSKEIANAMNTHNNIYLEIQNAFYNLKEKKNKIPVSTVNVKQAKENYDLSFGRYKVGVGDPVELKEAQLQLQNAELQYYNTLFEYNCARADLEKAIGKNIVENQITLDLDKDKLKAENKKLKEEERKAIEEDKALKKQEELAKKEQQIRDVAEANNLRPAGAEKKKTPFKEKLKKLFKRKNKTK